MNSDQKDVFYSLFTAFKILFVCWLLAFFANPFIFHTQFDLHSVWDGVAVLSGQGMLKLLMYGIDSALNSSRGEHPYVDAVIDTAKQVIGANQAPEGSMPNQASNTSGTETTGFRGQE